MPEVTTSIKGRHPFGHGRFKAAQTDCLPPGTEGRNGSLLTNIQFKLGLQTQGQNRQIQAGIDRHALRPQYTMALLFGQ